MQIFILFIVGFVLWITSPSCYAQDDSKILAWVNGQPVRALRYNSLLLEAKAAGNIISPEVKGQILDSLILNSLVEQEARRRGILKSSKFKDELASAYNSLVFGNLNVAVRASILPQIADLEEKIADIQAHPQEEFFVRDMVLHDYDAAVVALARVQAGEAFGDIARELSIDMRSKDEGGILGWNSAEALPAEMAGVLPHLRSGDFVKSPLQLPDGWHVFQLLDRRAITLPADAARMLASDEATNAAFDALLRKLHASAKIKRVRLP